MTTCSDTAQWSTTRVEPNNKLLGKRLGKDRARVVAALATLAPADVDRFQVRLGLFGWVGGWVGGCR